MKMIKKAITLCLGLVVMGSAAFAQSLDDAKKAIDAEQYQKAKTMLKALVSSQSKDGDNYYYLGEIFLQNDYLDSARAIFTQGVAADEKNPLNYVGLGHADLKSNNASSAKTNFDKAIDVAKKKDHIPYLYIGKAYISIEKPDFAAALPNLQKADELDSKDQDVETFVALGDFYAAQKKNSEALSNYLRALNINDKLLRAKVQIGRMYKESRAFPESETELKDAIAADPNYGPAYREIAELYMQWGQQLSQEFEAKSALAITNYKKYLDLTDKSFDSRLRYATFLFYARDFATLQTETEALSSVSPEDPKSLIVSRLRGYSAYENKDYPKSLEYMNDFFSNVKDTSRIVAEDYVYLGKAQLKAGQDSLALINIAKAVEKDSTNVGALAEIAKTYFDAKDWKKATAVYEKVNKLNPNGEGSLYNHFYAAIAYYYGYQADHATNKEASKDGLVKADSAVAKVAELAPATVDAYLWRARINNALDDSENPKGLYVPHYEKFIEMVTAKPELVQPNASKLSEAYDYLGGYYYNTDKEKAKEYFSKSIEVNPTGTYAPARLKELKAPAKPAGKK